MTTLPTRDAIGLLLYQWDALTNLDRTDSHYLQAAGLIISHAHTMPALRGVWVLDDVWTLMDWLSLWDAVTCGEERSRGDCLGMADLIMSGPGA